MSALAIPQRVFAARLLDLADDAPAGLRVAPGVDAQRRFAVHRNNVIATLVDALVVAFPVTRALVGDAFFRRLARERVRVDPPRSPIVNDYGDGFAEYIAAYAPAAGVAYLADVARLERLRGQSYHAADAGPLPADDFHALLAAPDRLAATRVRLHPAARWLASRHAVHALWEAHQCVDDAARDAALAAIDVDTPQRVLVIRPLFDVRLVALPDGGIAWLDALQRGASVGDALSQALAASADARPDLLFALLLQHGLVVQFDPAEES